MFSETFSCALHAFPWIYPKAEIYLPLLVMTEKYEPVHAKWTTERCAICRWIEDYDDNKIIICNRCFNYCWSLPLSCRIFWMIQILFQIYEALKVVTSNCISHFVFLFIMQMPNSSPPRMLWCKACSGFYILGL